MELMPFERDAMKGLPTPETLSSINTIIYNATATVYKLYRSKAVSKEAGADLINVLRTAYSLCKSVSELQVLQGEFWQHIYAAGNDYVFDSTIENADKFYSAVYGLPENWRCDRVAKLKNQSAPETSVTG